MAVRAVEPGVAVGRSVLALGLGLLALLLGLGAVLAPFYALAAALALLFVALTLWNLAAGLALFTLLTFFARVPGAGGGNVSYVKVAGGVLAFAWALALLRRGGTRVPLLLRERPLVAYALIALQAWTFASALWATSPGTAISTAFRLAQGILLVFVVVSAVSRPQHLRWIVWGFIVGALLTALSGLTGATHAEQVSPLTDTTRLEGGIGDPNELAALLVPALVIAGFLLVAIRGALRRWFVFGLVGVVAIALFLTESRGGLVALGSTLVFVPLFAGPVRARALTLVLTVAGVGIVYYGLIAPPEALARITNFTAGGGTGRTDLWGIATNMIKDHPVLGVGAGNFQLVEPSYALGNINLGQVSLVVDTPKVAHNTYLNVIAELGIIGMIPFLAVLLGAVIAAVRSVRALARSGQRELETISRGIVIGALAMFVAFLFISAQYEKQLWLMLGLLVALPSMVRRAVEPTPAAVSLAATELEPIPAAAGSRRTATPVYDLDVREHRVEQRERRAAAQVAALRAAREQFQRERLAFEAQIQAVRERVEAAEAAEGRATEVQASIAEREANWRALESQLAERQRAVARAEADILTRRSELETEERRHAVDLTRLAALDERETSLQDRAQAHERATAELAARTAALEERERATAEAEETDTQRLRDLEGRMQAVRRREQDLDQLRDELSRHERELAALRTKQLELDATLREREGRVAAAEESVRARADELDRRRRQLASLDERLAERQRGLAARMQEVERAAREQQSRAAALQERESELEELVRTTVERVSRTSDRKRKPGGGSTERGGT